MSNYRLISLVTSFSKTVEKIMHAILVNHSDKYNILSLEKYGFRKNLTLDNATYTLISEILTAMNNTPQAAGILCDVEKVSEYVNHNILLSKMEFYRIICKERNTLY